MVLPFLMIAKALKPMAKIKKGAWKAMGGAFRQVKQAVDPMKAFSKIFEIISVLMLPLTVLFTIFAKIILTELMPYIIELIKIIEDLGEVAEDSAGWLDEFIILVGEQVDFIVTDTVRIWDAFTTGIDDIVTYIEDAWEDLIDDLEDLLPDFGGFDGGGGGGDGGGGPPGFFDPIFGGPGSPGTPENPILPIYPASTTNNTININLQNSVIDNRDKLIRDIAEQVTIRFG